jgi:hypothetical protein
LEPVHEHVREEWRKRMTDSPDEAAKIGESLFLTIERTNDLEKAEIFGMLFLAYIDHVITSDELRRLSQAVDIAFIDDVKKLLESHKLPTNSAETWMLYLSSSGLTQVVAGKTFSDAGSIYYEATSLANKLKNAFYHGRRVRA